MDLLLFLVGLLVFISFVVLSIVSVIKKNGKVKKQISIAGAAFFLMVIGLVIPNDSSEKTSGTGVEEGEEVQKEKEPVKTDEVTKEEASVEEEEEPKVQEQPSIPGTLGYNPEEFKDRFNKAAQEFQLPFSINNLQVEDGAVQDVFQYKLNDHMILSGSVNKADGSVRDVLLLARGDGTPSSGTNIMLTIGTLIASTNPNLSADERGNVLGDLGLLDDNVNIMELDKETVRNNVKYHFSASEQIGIMFSAGDVNDK